MSAVTLLFPAKRTGAPGYQLKQPGVLTEGQVRGGPGIGLKALQLWVSMVTQAPPSLHPFKPTSRGLSSPTSLPIVTSIRVKRNL